MTVRIRTFVPEDAVACGDIVAATPLWQRYKLSAAVAAEQLTQGHGRGEAVLVIESDGAVAGFAWILPVGAFGLSPYLRRIAVAPGLRGQQLGARLMDAVEEHAARLSADLFLLVSDFNEDAQRFYLRRGFLEIGRIPEFATPGVAEVLLRKRLR